MTQPLKTEAGRLAAHALADAARQGVERALAARQAMTELTPAQTLEVSGAAAIMPIKTPIKIIKPPIIYGLIYPLDPQLDIKALPATKL